MKAAPLLVSWHDDNTPIYSAHFEPHGKGRLATAGGDNNVRVGQPRRLKARAMLTAAALEGRGQRRRAQGQLPGYPREALPSCKRRTMGPERCFSLAHELPTPANSS
jgi:hypothetical protein